MESNQKQRIVEKIKKATNILVTVSRNPSVDELSAALGFTLMLNKMDKHATAVFSGATPPAITFLEPHKTFEQNTDSLRDFIVALDKEKADRLRYKVEDDVVRIYITPYQTTITEADLQFSQGDFNVELIVALGVKDKVDLDQAIAAHGRILHDATVATINIDEAKGNLSSIEWNDKKASSLCEMLMSLSEALQPNILDEQISTALLTGIVAATDRFSNQQTSPRVMTMSAQLMAAGANQQLIADELAQAEAIKQPVDATIEKPASSDGQLKEGASAKIERKPPSTESQAKESKKASPPIQQPKIASKQSSDGSIHIDHDKSAAQATAEQETQQALDAALSRSAPKTPTLSVTDLQNDLAAESNLLEEQLKETPAALPTLPPLPPIPEPSAPAQNPAQGQSSAIPSAAPAGGWQSIKSTSSHEPTYGSPLTATAQQAAEAKRLAEARDRNRTLLSHDAPSATHTPGGDSVSGQTEAERAESTSEGNYNSQNDGYGSTRGKDLQPVTMQSIASDPSLISQTYADTSSRPTAPAPVAEPETPTIAELEDKAQRSAEPADERASSLEAARSEIDHLFGSVDGYEVTPLPGQEPATPPAVAPQFSDPQPQQPAAAPTASGQSAMPPLPPLTNMMPDFTTLPPLPNELQTSPSPHPGANAFEQPPAQPAPAPATAPGQFQIPGQ